MNAARDAFDIERLFKLLDALPGDVAERAREHLRRRASAPQAGQDDRDERAAVDQHAMQNEAGKPSDAQPSEAATDAATRATRPASGEREPAPALHPLLAKIRIEIPADVARSCSPADLILLAHQMMQADDLRGMSPARKPVDNEIGDLLRAHGEAAARPTITLKRSRLRDAGAGDA